MYLLDYLLSYEKKGLYPFHMPGHKRNPDFLFEHCPDLTEVPGTDDLHHPDGILLENMEMTARLYNVKRTFFLVNGSTCGNLSSVFAALSNGDECIAARNCHRSVFHALELRNIKVHWAVPALINSPQIFGEILPSEIERLLKSYPSSKAVIITSPSYEGIISDIRSISKLCHERNIPLLVDEAHGAHLGLSEYFPDGAVKGGADIIVQSPHKVLFSLTQSAFLHFNSSIVSEERLKKYLSVFQSSSPSYPLMASLSETTRIILEKKDLFKDYYESLSILRRRLSSLKHLSLFSEKCFSFDPGKILICTGKTSLSGFSLCGLLRERGFMPELSMRDYVLLMTSPADKKEALMSLADALLDIDSMALFSASENASPISPDSDADISPDSDADISPDSDADISSDDIPDASLNDGSISNSSLSKLSMALGSISQEMTLGEAAELEGKMIPLKDSLNMLSAEYLYSYPPGIPILAPGERISEEIIFLIEDLSRDSELNISGHGVFQGWLPVIQSQGSSA